MSARRWIVVPMVAMIGGTHVAAAQGRCIRAYGTPACNTDPITPVFARTGWRTTSLDHIAFRVADPQKEAAFYAALMGWKVRSDDGTRVVMDIGDWGSVVFRRAPVDSFPPARSGRANATPVRAVVEGLGFDIEPWNAKTVEAELRKRGLSPIADNDGKGYESFHIKDPDGFDVQIGNGKRYAARDARLPPPGSSPLPRRLRSSRRGGRLCGSTISRSARRTTRPALPSTSTCSAGVRRTTKEVRTS